MSLTYVFLEYCNCMLFELGSILRILEDPSNLRKLILEFFLLYLWNPMISLKVIIPRSILIFTIIGSYILFLLKIYYLFFKCLPIFPGRSNGTGSNNTFTYQFHGDPRATFAQFFGSSNPFASFFDMGDNLFDKNVFDLDTEHDFFSSPFGGLGSRHGLGGAFR